MSATQEVFKFNTSLPPTKTTHLPVIDALLSTADITLTQPILEKTLIYYVHHPLQTSVNVIDSLVKLGAKYENIFILGKHYSQCDAVVASLIKRGVCYQQSSMQTCVGQYATAFTRDVIVLWFKLLQHLNPTIENVLILDHGGHAVKFVPPEILNDYRVIGIEKTSAGLFDLDKRGSLLFPIIDVANCPAKRHLEAPLIAKAVVNKLFTQLPLVQTQGYFGVVGLGAIGQAIVKQLINLGKKPLVFDSNPSIMQSFQGDPQVICVQDSRDLITVCDWVFGCSGRDISENALSLLKLTPMSKTFISCSSEDKEFLALIRFIEQQKPLHFNPLETLEFQTELGATIRVLRGGFPANFDQSGESVPAHEIQLTRALVIAAVLQAVELLQREAFEVESMLHPLNWPAQQFIVSEWLSYQQQCGEKEWLIQKWLQIVA